MNFGEMIHNRRVEQGLTLDEVGAACGVGKSTVRKWETGMIQNMRRNKIILLAKVLKMDPIDLVTEQTTTVIPFDNFSAPKKITTEERMLIQAYREAKAEYKVIAMEILTNHKKEETK